jgi:hypothetical protein
VPANRPRESPMTGLSDHDPPPDRGGGRPPLVIAVVIAVVVTAVVVLHVIGVLGPGAH